MASYASTIGSLQNALTTVGFDTPISNVYDAMTVSMVKAFQNYAGLGVDGVAGPKTLTALNAELDKMTANGDYGASLTLRMDPTLTFSASSASKAANVIDTGDTDITASAPAAPSILSSGSSSSLLLIGGIGLVAVGILFALSHKR